MTRALLLTAGLFALAAPAVAQTGYGQPSPSDYRAEQRATATLNRQWDARGDESVAGDEDDRDPRQADGRRLRYGGYDRPLEDRDGRDYDRDRGDYARQLADDRRARADYRRRSGEHRADVARWRDRVAACNDGVRSACAGYEERYGDHGGGRYAAPAPRGYAPAWDRRVDQRDDDRATEDGYDAGRADGPYTPNGDDYEPPYRR